MKKNIVFIMLVFTIALSAVEVYGQSDVAKSACSRGNIAREQRNYDLAIKEYTEAIRLYANYNDAYFGRGMAYREKKELDKAITDFTQAIQLKPNDYYTYYFQRGIAYYRKNDYDRAIADYNKSLQLNPDDPDTYFYRAEAHSGKKDYDRAIADFTQAIELYEDDYYFYFEDDISYAYSERGWTYIIKKDYDKAIADFYEALEWYPDNEQAEDGLARARQAKQGGSSTSNTPQPAPRPTPPPQPAPVYVTQTCSTCKGNKKVNCFLCGGRGTITSEGFTVSGYGMVPDVYIPGASIPCTYALCVNGKVDCNTCGGKGTVQVLQTAAQPAQPQPRPTTPTPTPTPAPQPTPAPEQLPPRGVIYPTITRPNAIPPSAWKPSDGESPGVTKRGFVRKEVIDGQERDTFAMEVTFPTQTASGGGKWGAATINDEPNLSKIRTATGVRFKAMGDGKRWIIQFHTKESMTDWGSYEAEIKTVPNRVVEINIPYSSLAQPSWGKKVPFVKNNIMSVNLQRMTDNASETGASTLKVFDFEVYSGSEPAAAPTANVNPNFIPPSLWKTGSGDAAGVTKKIFNNREVIAGQERDVVTMEATFPRQNGSKWATFDGPWSEPYLSRLRAGSGIRFKAQGDGKRWIIQFIMKVSGEDCCYEAEIKTTNNRVVDINIPYSSLKQADWSKKAPWNKNNIVGVNIQRNSSDSGNTSTLKIFDFEIF